MALQLIDSGTIAPANLSAGYVALATLAAPDPVADGSGSSFAYTLVVRMSGLAAAHALRLRETQGAAVETENVTGNGQAVDEFIYDELLGAGEDDVALELTDTVAGSGAASVEWLLYREANYVADATPLPPPSADGYYAKTLLIRMSAGEELYNAEFRLDALATVADPQVVADAIRLADNTVEAIAYKVGLDLLTTGAGAGHAIAPTDEPVYTELSLWASRWARAAAHAMRPEEIDPDRPDVDGTPPEGTAGQPEAGFTGARREAERRIKEILTAKFNRTQRGAVDVVPSDDIIAVGWNGCTVPAGIDSTILG